MRHKLRMNWFICLCFFLFSTSSVIGDIAPNPVSAPNLRPLSPTSVRMVSEVVTVDLYKDSATVEVLFEMKNLGETETVEIGFPIMDFYFGWKTSLFVGQKSEGDRFKVWIDEKPVEDIKIYGFNFQEISLQEKSIAQKKQDILREDNFLVAQQVLETDKQFAPASIVGHFNVMPWYIWNTIFHKGETRWIKVHYSLPKGTNKRNDFFNYVLHTGANWNETIGKAMIKVNIHDIPDEDIQRIVPKGYTKEGDVISWTFTDFEPTVKEDIFIYYRKDDVEHQLENTDVYLDNKEANFNHINPEDIAHLRVERSDTLNFPYGAVFVYTKEFDFALLKELVKKVSPRNFKELAVLEVDDFYNNYEIKIIGEGVKKGESFHYLSVDNIASITIDRSGNKKQLIITER